HTRWPRDWSSDVCSSDLSGPDCVAEPAHQRTYRPFQDPQERQSFPPWAAKDGLTAAKLARLLEADEYTAVPRSSWSTWIASIRRSEERRVGKGVDVVGES